MPLGMMTRLGLRFLIGMVLTVFFVISFQSAVFATAQLPDILVYNGKEYAMHSNPMEEFFRKNPDKRPQITGMCSALWRGYVAKFEVINGELYVTGLFLDACDGNRKNQLKKVFPGVKKVKVDWLSGVIVLPNGSIVEYVHMGYLSTYENYILLEVTDGVITKEKNFTLDEFVAFSEQQLQAFKATQEYEQLKANYGDDFDAYLQMQIFMYTPKFLVD